MDVRSIRDKVYEQIRLDILKGVLGQGERVSVNDLAQRFHISSQPVRDAIIRLGEEGLVQVHPRRGTFVTTIPVSRIIEINAAREMIESYAIEHIDVSAHQDVLRDIEQALEEMSAIRSRPQYEYLEYNAQDFRFHLGTVMLAGNETITTMYRKLHPHYLYAMVMFNFATTTLGRHEDHEEIFMAIKSGHLREAAQTAERHTREATQTLLELMNAAQAANASAIPS
ncbi:MAG: hypothetical protein C7B45_15105 [Sulfobacillus acidophilus]|uniref:HTH gntR-type domain-containing protein n=1 Tax=Sulfobacillus acidophilus TaxID=53633 RepID=A0A2T2WDV4_9FIRM|nr:MAG: hypothetical protein C7B45_15105 [Sulfobacillus acidophilus]